MSNTNTPLVSIGIPTYNRPEGLKKTIECFINQSYKNLEIIISDNNSENPEVQILCEKYQNKDSRIKYFRQKANIGMYKNFEFVKNNSFGEFFTWASDDDVFDTNYIETCYSEFIKNKKLVLAGPICIVKENGKEIFLRKHDFNTEGLELKKRIKKIAFYIKKSHMAFYGLYKSEVIKKVPVIAMPDCDGRILLECSIYGEFKMIYKPLVHALRPHKYADRSTRMKMIKDSDFKYKFFLRNFENLWQSMVFSLFIFKHKKINFFEKFNCSYITYRSFHITSSLFKLNSKFKNILFYIKPKKKLIHIINDKKCDEKTIKKIIEKAKKHYDNIIITTNFSNIYNDTYITKQISTHKNINHSILKWRNKADEIQYVLDLCKFNLTYFTHVRIIRFGDKIEFKKYDKLINSFSTFNKSIFQNNQLKLYPVRDYTNVNLDLNITTENT